MTRIHPTAVVEKGAELDDSVEVGPYSVIGADVSIGSGTVVGSHTVIEGLTTIGQENRLGHHAAIGGRPQDMKYAGEKTRLVIGNRTPFVNSQPYIQELFKTQASPQSVTTTGLWPTYISLTIAGLVAK
jgi:acyl-[acyl carrier protein]--UDP-N-acetylglucosamine O-acyltransferase